MSTATTLFNNFLGFLNAHAGANPALAPITTDVAAASKAVVVDVVAQAPALVTHELDVIAAHNKASPYIGVAADLAKLVFTAWAANATSTAVPVTA